MPTQPVFKYSSLDSPVVYYKNRAITLGELLRTVNYLYEKIPAHHHLLNLYEERYYFLLGFLLALKQQSISLFPSTITNHVFNQLNEHYADILVLSDSTEANQSALKQFEIIDLKILLEQTDFVHNSSLDLWSVIPEIELNKEIAIIFTSGSTGQPKPYIKQWNDLLISAHNLTQTLFSKVQSKRITSNPLPLHTVLATVPAQHMYGLEVSIIAPLQNGFMIHSDKPFFPQDITQCLEELKQFSQNSGKTIETSIITTPLHLKACIKTQIALPGVKQFISATAPLQTELAKLCEQQYAVLVMEIFGCTEVGTIAYRQTSDSEKWTVLDDITLKRYEQNDIQIITERSIQSFLFNDMIELLDERHFIHKGRKEDLINIAGKRTSLAYLNHQIQSYNFLMDACFYQDDSLKDTDTNTSSFTKESRLIAFVVIDNLSSKDEIKRDDLIKVELKEFKKNIRSYLKERIESIFLPKRIYFVNVLPRNSTGKLPHSELKKLLQQQESK